VADQNDDNPANSPKRPGSTPGQTPESAPGSNKNYNVDPENPYSDQSAEVSSEIGSEVDADSGKAHEEAPNAWPLEADRVAIHDPLVNCLKLLAGHYGRRASVASLTSI